MECLFTFLMLLPMTRFQIQILCTNRPIMQSNPSRVLFSNSQPFPPTFPFDRDCASYCEAKTHAQIHQLAIRKFPSTTRRRILSKGNQPTNQKPNAAYQGIQRTARSQQSGEPSWDFCQQGKKARYRKSDKGKATIKACEKKHKERRARNRRIRRHKLHVQLLASQNVK